MYLWAKFSRVTAAGPTPWTIDALPTDASGAQTAPNPTKNDNIISITPRDNVGWPPHRLAIAYHGPNGAASLTATLYVFDKNTNRYYIVGTSGGITLVPETINFVSILSLANPPTLNANADQGLAGGSDFLLIVNPTAATTVGTYTFAMAPDLVQQ